MAMCGELWAAGIKAEFVMAASPNMQRQLTHALEAGIPLVVIFGGDELAKGVVKVKDLAAHVEEDVPRATLVEDLRRRIAALPAGAAVALG